MPYAVHHRVTLSGILGTVANPVDGFSTGFCLSATLQQAPAAWEAAVKDACLTFWARPLAHIAPRAILQEVKVSLKDILGHDSAPPVRFIVPNTPGGGSGASDFPNQVSLAVSLGAASERRRAKGRFFLPTPHVGYQASTDNMTPQYPVDIVAAVGDLLTAVKTASGEQVVVASSKDGNHVVTTVRVGNRLDTMRSRRNANGEVYQSVALP